MVKEDSFGQVEFARNDLLADLFQCEIAWNLHNRQWVPLEPRVCEDIKRDEIEFAHNASLYSVCTVSGLRAMPGGAADAYMLYQFWFGSASEISPNSVILDQHRATIAFIEQQQCLAAMRRRHSVAI